jgi:hypothetical protein
MNFSTTNDTNDVLRVNGSALTLAGTLVVNCVDTPNPQLPNAPLALFEDFKEPGLTASLSGGFGAIQNNVNPNANYNSWVNTDITNDYYWELTIH